MDHYLLETDGSFNPQYQFCGIGGALYKNGELIHYYSALVNQHYKDHESVSLLYGLLLAKKLGITELDIKMDSSVHTNYFNQIDDPFSLNLHQKLVLIPRIEDVLHSFNYYSISYQSREQNIVADNLAGLYKKGNGFHLDSPQLFEDYFTQDMFVYLESTFLPKQSLSIFKILPTKDSSTVVINHLHFDITTQQIMLTPYYVNHTIKDITDILCHIIPSQHTYCAFSGIYSDMLTTQLHELQHLGYPPHEAFLTLTPYWNYLSKGKNITDFEISKFKKKR